MLEGARDRLQERVEAVPYWFHSIDLGDGIVTPGHKPAAVLAQEFDALGLPDLHGKSVLDIGGWDGYFAFEAERRGAVRVGVVDHLMWSVDRSLWTASEEEKDAYRREHHEAGTPPPQHELTEFWHPDTMPGKLGFDIARAALSSGVEDFAVDFMDCDLEAIGQWDVVLYLGVLYHMTDPLGALRRVAAVTRELAVVETEAVVFPGLEHEPLWRFFPEDELSGDITNWWAPNRRGLQSALTTAGFRSVRSLKDPTGEELEHALPHFRAVAQATK